MSFSRSSSPLHLSPLELDERRLVLVVEQRPSASLYYSDGGGATASGHTIAELC